MDGILDVFYLDNIDKVFFIHHKQEESLPNASL